MMMNIRNSRHGQVPFPIDRGRLKTGSQTGRRSALRLAPHNVAFHYLYRDGANYKQHGVVVFTNHTFLSIEEVERQIRPRLHEGEYFIARQVHIEERFFTDVGEDDHPWHEFVKVEVTAEPASDPINRDILMFLHDLGRAERGGWDRTNVRADMAQLLKREMLDLRQAFETGRTSPQASHPPAP